jgi:hypothetical protein
MMASNIIFGILRLIPFVIVLIATILILNQTRSAGALLMLIGQAINIIPLIFGLIGPFLMHQFEMSRIHTGYAVTGGVNFIGALLFGIGLLLLAKDNLKPKETVKF